jgi:beta-glucosidase
VTVGDSSLARDFDLFAAAGGARKVAAITGSVEHEDDALRGPLKISFVAKKGAAKFNTIELKNANGASAVSFSASELADAFSAAATKVPEVSEPPIWRDASHPLKAREEDLIRRMSLAEKVAQLKNGAPGIPRLGLPERSVAWRRQQRLRHGFPGTGGRGFVVESGIISSGRDHHRH